MKLNFVLHLDHIIKLLTISQLKHINIVAELLSPVHTLILSSRLHFDHHDFL